MVPAFVFSGGGIVIAIPFEGVQTQFSSFIASPIVLGSTQWIVGIGIASFALSKILQAFSK